MSRKQDFCAPAGGETSQGSTQAIGSSAEIFYSNATKTDACWNWNGKLSSAGYGKFHRDGKTIYAHRTSWEISNGPIPDGLWVLHRCDNRRCVNPDHLFLGTVLDNTRDMIAKGRRRKEPKGEDSPCAKLTWEKVFEIKSELARGIRKSILARRYGVSFTAIRYIAIGRTWISQPPEIFNGSGDCLRRGCMPLDLVTKIKADLIASE